MVLLIIGLMATFKLKLGLNQNFYLVKESDAYDFFQTQYQYDEAGPPAYIVFKNVDYTDNSNLE